MNRAHVPSWIFPWRYGMFLLLLTTAIPLLAIMPWHEAAMTSFDCAALAFIVSLYPLIDADPARLRRSAERNDAGRSLMLLLTAIVSIIVLVAVGVAVGEHSGRQPAIVALLLVTLALAWLFSNLIYAMHYAHLFYLRGPAGKDRQGLDFPETPEPEYPDFLYFSFTLGMTFQTSDVAINDKAMRSVVVLHCLAAFVFNLGILAFTINVLGGG
ncbi:DUF1345 domain-containing protein [Sphingobium mellinum]|uniref:DUF1345 domain-containing protein n=1 Tax=Sphingobium mellinum TaxID=1387166 RepID=UPI003BF4D020